MCKCVCVCLCKRHAGLLNMCARTGTMFEMQAKEEKVAEFEGQLRKLTDELAEATRKLIDTEKFGESERDATQEALDELTKDLSTAHEQLAIAEERAEDAERRAQASQQAAATGVARLTHVTVGMAADEDNNTDMIDPELRLHWCDDDYERKLAETKTPHELRALLVGIASTVEHLLNNGAARRDQVCIYTHIPTHPSTHTHLVSLSFSLSLSLSLSTHTHTHTNQPHDIRKGNTRIHA